MYNQCLVTATLLDSFDFAMSAPNSPTKDDPKITWKQRGMKDFVGKIRREKVEYPSWVGMGMDFENVVYDKCRSSRTIEDATDEGSEAFKAVVKEVYGGVFQNKLKRVLHIGSHKAFLFGFSDVEKDNLTIDIKTCKDWKGPQKYLDKAQHEMYLYMNGKDNFKYVVAEWDKDGNGNPIKPAKNVYTVDYINPGENVLEKRLTEKIEKMWDYLVKENLWDDYWFTFSKN